MKYYTKTGDKGTTSLYNGDVIPKNNQIFEVIGNLDELTCRIGTSFCFFQKNFNILLDDQYKNANENFKQVYNKHAYEYKELADLMEHLQKMIQIIMSVIATPPNDKQINVPNITENDISYLEKFIDFYSNNTPNLTKFILPCTSELDSYVHLCRTQTRITEIKLWQYNEVYHRDEHLIILKYLNRMSSLFFTMARYITCISYETERIM